jgi:hypothetical protein
LALIEGIASENMISYNFTAHTTLVRDRPLNLIGMTFGLRKLLKSNALCTLKGDDRIPTADGPRLTDHNNPISWSSKAI